MTCTVDSCEKPARCKGFCNPHYQRFKRHGDPLAGGGSRNRIPGSTSSVTQNGYRRIKVGNDWPLEHRHVMSKALGRPLYPDEHVHHRDGNKLNNEIENLELWVRPQPTGIRATEAIAWAKEILRRYEGS